MRFELRPRIGMAPKPAPRPHAAKNRVGAIGRNACLEPAAGALAHRALLRCDCSMASPNRRSRFQPHSQTVNQSIWQSIDWEWQRDRRKMLDRRKTKKAIDSTLFLCARASVLTPPNAYNPGARINANGHARELKAKRPDAPKAAGLGFLLIFQHIREKTPTSTPSTLLNALLCFFSAHGGV